jgi:hypothetical protein
MLVFKPFGMFVAIALGFIAATWVRERSLERKQNRRRIAQLVEEEAILWEATDPSTRAESPTASQWEASTADARVAAAVRRAAQAEAEASEAILLAAQATTELQRLRRSVSRASAHRDEPPSGDESSDDEGWSHLPMAHQASECTLSGVPQLDRAVRLKED